MKKLLKFLLENITDAKNFEIRENKDEDRVEFEVICDKDNIGLIIGKGGNTIKAIQNILRVRAQLEKVAVYISVSEKE